MVRAFVALELSRELRDRLAEAQQVLRGCGANLNFVDPAIIHITVKFLGEVGEKDLPGIITALKNVTFSPFTVRATTVTVDNPARPRTVWCPIEDGGESARLFHSIENTLEPLGFPRETRRFTPHATIARVKRMDPSLLPAVSSLKGRVTGTSVITGFNLKKSTLTPHGPIYEDLLEVAW